MVIFNATYSWDGKKRGAAEPVSWWPCTYHLKIVDLSAELDGVLMIKPYLCIYSNKKQGFSVVAHPERLAQRICDDFKLEMEKVMWVENEFGGDGDLQIITFKKKGQMGDLVFYTPERRDPMESERDLIEPHLFKNSDRFRD